MRFLEKVTESAGIALNYVAGVASIWFGLVCSLGFLVFWGVAGVGLQSALIFGMFGLTPIGGGVWLFRRGKIQKELFKVKLQKEVVRELAFTRQGRLRPIELATEQDWTEERALTILKNLAAEDADRIELQFDYDSGEIYFEFPEIMRAIEARQQYQALPISQTLERGAVEMAMKLGKTIETFLKYKKYTTHTMSEHQKKKKEEKYRAKIERFLGEIDELKNQ